MKTRLLLTILSMHLVYTGMAQLERFTIRRYDQLDGLTDAGLRDLFFDRQSRLWIATTSAGISLFDGKTFHTVSETESLSNNFAFRSAEGNDGSIWVATRNGVNRVRPAGVDSFLTSASGDRSGFFTNITTDRQGTIYAMGFPGLFRFNGQTFSKVNLGDIKQVMFGYCSPENEHFLVTDRGILRWKLNGASELIDSAKGLAAKNIYRIRPYGDTAILIGAFDGFFIYDLLRKTSRRILTRKNESIAALAMEKLDDRHWIVSDGAGGLYRFNGQELELMPWPYPDAVSDIKRDRFGNVWIAGTYLYKLSPSPSSRVLTDSVIGGNRFAWQYFEMQTKVGYVGKQVRVVRCQQVKEYSFPEPVSAVFVKGDSTFIGCADGSVWVCRNNSKVRILDGNAVNKQKDIVHTMTFDTHGHLWVGRNFTVARIHPDKAIQLIPFADGQGLATYHILQRRDGLFIANEKGLYQLSNGSLFSPVAPAGTFKHTVRYCKADHLGRIWFAEDGKGVGIWDASGKISYLPKVTGVDFHEIQSIHFSGAGIAWLKHTRGLVIIGYDSTRVVEMRSFPFTSIGMRPFSTSINEVGDSLFLADHTSVAYFHGEMTNQNASLVFRIRPTQDSSKEVFPEMQLLSDQSITLRKGGGAYAIQVDGIDFSDQKVRLFSFELTRDEETISVMQANGLLNLGQLDPGQYRLTIREGENSFMLGRGKVYVLNLIVPARWYQTLLFRLIMLIFLLLIVLFASFQFVRRRERKQRLILENERKKIELENRVLKNQLDPHLVFNLLNNVQSTLLLSSRENAVESISSLSKFLRQSLELSKSSEIYLEEEVEYIRDYLAFKLEGADDVVIEFDVSALRQLPDTRVPALLWQPLIENAVKYVSGIQKSISVCFFTNGTELIGEISNSVSSELMTDKAGNGLRLVRERVELLNQLHGVGTASFETGISGSQFKASIRINRNVLDDDTEI